MKKSNNQRPDQANNFFFITTFNYFGDNHIQD